MQNMSFSRSKKNQSVIFWLQTFFQSLTFQKIFNSESNALYLLQSKILSVVFFYFKIWHVVKLFVQNQALKSFFSGSQWIIIQVLPTSKKKLLEIDNGLG